jgi:hypothetical protein
MPDPLRLLNTLRQALDAFRNTPGRQGRFVELTEVADCLIVGDMHGHLENFRKVLEVAQLDQHPQRHLVVQELIHSPEITSARGDLSHRLLDLVAALKCQYPERVHYLLGNHELSQWTDRAIMKNAVDLNQYFLLGISTTYGEQAEAIYAAYKELFAALPVAIRLPNRVFLSHSLPNAQRLGTWELSALYREEITSEDIGLGGAIHSVVWGRDVCEPTAERYLAKVDADLLISGHIPCEGYQTPNSRQLILDTKDTHGCICWVPCHQPLTHADLVDGLIPLYPAP